MTVITLILFFERRCIRFSYNIFSSENQLYTSMIKYSLTNCDSTLGENIRYPMHKYEFDMHQWYGSFMLLFNKIDLYSDVSRISFRGVVQNFSGKVGVFAWREAPCSAWRSHAFAREIRGHAPPRKFLKMVQFGAFYRV